MKNQVNNYDEEELINSSLESTLSGCLRLTIFLLIILTLSIIVTLNGCSKPKKMCDAYHTGNPHQIEKRK